MTGRVPAAAAPAGGPDRLDLRLLPAAAAAWLAAVAGLVAPRLCWWLAGGCAAGAVACVAVGVRGGRAAVVAAGALLVGAAAASSCGLRVAAVRGGPLAAAAEQRRVVDLDLTIGGDPRVGQSTAAAGAVHTYVVAPATVHAMRSAGRSWRVSAPVLLIAPSVVAWSGLLPSQRLHVTGRLSPPRGHELLAAVVTVRGPPRLVGRPSAVQRLAGRLRAGLATAARAVPQPTGGLLPGLVDGDTSRLDPRLAHDFRTVGMTHLVAVSGANTGVVVAAALWLTRWLTSSVRAGAVVAGLALAGFVVVARPEPSVLRAAAMAALLLAGVLTGRRASPVPALLAGVLVLLLADPALAVQPGFGLSVSATGSLLVLAPPLARRLRRRLPRRLADLAAVAIAAQLACLPLLVALWGQLSPVAVPANMLAEPAVPAATVLGCVTALVAVGWPTGAQWVARAAALPAGWLAFVARRAAALPMAGLTVRPGPGSALLVVAALGLLVPAWRWRPVRRVLAAGAVGLTVAWGGALVVAPGWPPPGWVFVACDVGQGDGLVVAVSPGAAMVVDAGPDPVAVDGCLRRLSVRSVPVLVLSHLHADHVEGVPGVLSGRRVAMLAVGPLDQPAVEGERVRAWAGAAGVVVRPLAAGARLTVGAVSVDVIAPTRVLHGTDSDPNNDSLVLRVHDRGVTLLLTGDVEAAAQQVLLSSGADLTADVLKVPHHGSANQLPAFLAAVHARVAVVSVGADNTYGQPAPPTLGRLAADGMSAYRTDRDGDVAVVVRAGRVAVVRRGHPLGGRAMPAPPRGQRLPPAWAAPPGRPLALARGRRDRAASSTRGARGRVLAHARSPGPAGRGRSPPSAGRFDTASCGPRGAGAGATSEVHAMLDDMAGEALAAVTLVTGEEEFLVAREVSRVVAAVRESDPEADVRDLAGADITLAALDEALSPSLFGDRRVVIVRAAQDCPKDVAEEIVRYAAAPLDETLLVATHSGGARGKALVTGLQAARARVVECPTVRRPSERADFVRAEVRAAGGRITEGAVRAVIDAVGNDLRELSTAVGQLVADTGGQIDDEVVARYYRGKAEATGFVIADRAVEGDAAGALELLRWGLGVGLAPVLVTSALATSIRSIAKVAAAGRGSPAALAKRLGMPPWKIERTQRQARGWRPEAIARALSAVATADNEVKGGGADPAYALERAVLEITAARAT